MVTWPSGKAKVCKTFIHQFKSGRHLHKTVIKKMSRSFFFAVSLKIGGFANQFLNTGLQCCPTTLGQFSHPNAHFFCHFLEFGRGGAIFLRRNRINPAVFRMFSISPQPISCWLRGFFVFPDSFQFVFKFSILHQFKKARNSHEHHYRYRPRLLRHQNSPLLIPGRAYQLRRTRTLRLLIFHYLSVSYSRFKRQISGKPQVTVL